MARRNREINIFNIAFLDVITGAMGAFVLMVLLLAPYYTGADVNTLKRQQAAQDSVDKARADLQKAQEVAKQNDNAGELAKKLAEAQDELTKAREQLNGLKQQLDQMSAQNKRLTKLDDQQQQQLKESQNQIADLQRQAAQATKQALDRAEQNMQKADQTVQSGDLEQLKKLLAQARADLAAARKQLEDMQKQLTAMQAELRDERAKNAALQQQLNTAQQRAEALVAENDSLKREIAKSHDEIANLKESLNKVSSRLQQAERELGEANNRVRSMQQQRDKALSERDEALKQRDKSVSERNKAASLAQAEGETLNKSMPTPAHWILLDYKASPSCGATKFTPTAFRSAEAGQFAAFASKESEIAFLGKASSVTFSTPDAPGQADSSHAFHILYMVPVMQNMKLLVGLQALSQPPGDCGVALSLAMTTIGGGTVHNQWWRLPQVAMSNTLPVLFAAVPPATGQSPAVLGADDIALWKANEKDGTVAQTSAPSAPFPMLSPGKSTPPSQAKP
jgi:uncharacterized coiled-coil DUF342 family protein